MYNRLLLLLNFCIEYECNLTLLSSFIIIIKQKKICKNQFNSNIIMNEKRRSTQKKHNKGGYDTTTDNIIVIRHLNKRGMKHYTGCVMCVTTIKLIITRERCWSDWKLFNFSFISNEVHRTHTEDCFRL